MLEVNRKVYGFKIKDVWWDRGPFHIDNCDLLTFHSCQNRLDVDGFYCEEFSTLIIDISGNLDDIWKNMSKSSCRYAINRAKRDGVKVKLGKGSDYKLFYEMDSSFRKSKNLKTNYFFPDMMENYGTLFLSEYEGEILGGQLYIEDMNNIRWLFGASNRLNVEKDKATLIGNANKLLIWEAINYAWRKGIKRFDMGGYYTGNNKEDPRYAINSFKQSFGGELVKYYKYICYYSILLKVLKYANIIV